MTKPIGLLSVRCSQVSPSDTFAISICQPKSESVSAFVKFVDGLPTLIISVIALGVSLTTLYYNKRKDERVRQQSIEDDFWLRKVVSPLSIEPFLKHIHEIAAALPIADGSTKQSVSDFWSAQTAKFGAFNVAFRTLDLIDVELSMKVGLELEKIEDELASYCGDLGRHLDGAVLTRPDSEEASQKLIALTIGVFQLIKGHQTTVGTGR